MVELRPFYGRLDNRIVIFENEQGTHVGWKCVHSGEQNLDPPLIDSHCCSLTFWVSFGGVAYGCPVLVVLKTSITMSHKPHARIPSGRRPASKEMTSASVQLRDTAVCFPQDQPN